MSDSPKIERIKTIERILEFPSEGSERKFKNALERLPMKHSRLVEHRRGGELEFTLELRPDNLDDFRKKLKDRGLGECPVTCLIFRMLCDNPGEVIRLRTWA